ncbi:NTF2-like N-terminal transpeptidase domain-containing protein [Halothiobacillus sp. DCM-1]|uniref:NTF2-like N-terminal transpeptidase domain-containing protein n=1 Tax=Halothiobacillus sp. DCM-1 TaxID=3112558 RepID=UPI0032561606
MIARSTLLALAALPFLITACSSGPSSADVEKALKDGMQKAVKEAQSQGGETAGKMVAAMMSAVEIHAVKVQECKKDSAEKGYDCTVELKVKTPMAGEQTTTKQLHLVKGNDGWEIRQ